MPIQPSLKEELQSWLNGGLSTWLPELGDVIVLERTKNVQHGDYSTNIAMQLAKKLKMSPREVAISLIARLASNPPIAKIIVEGAGFINLHLTHAARTQVVHDTFEAGDAYGRSDRGNRQRVMVEYVSANPTGPLHVGHGRGAVIGDVLATLLEWQGWEVFREFYYNDSGAQIHNLALSVQARIREFNDANHPFPEQGYHGEYIREIARAYLQAHLEDVAGDNLAAITRFAVQNLRQEQDRDLTAFGVCFDGYYLESSLYEDGRVEEVIDRFMRKGKAYEKDGALWLNTGTYGDDKDRVMRKSDGSYTYFVPDVAYHVTKWERGFTRVINEQGADHHSTVTRVRAGLQALELGIPEHYPEYVLHQMVTVMRGGEEVKISKRAGSYVTVRDLIDQVGCDAVRFFFVMRKHDSQLIFDIDLARSQSEENPVYYVQYAHARICSVFREAKIDPQQLRHVDLAGLTSEHEQKLLRRLADFHEVLALATRELSPHLIPFYLKDLAADFHSYYNAERFLVEDDSLRKARLALVAGTGQVLRNGLTVLGVSAPEKM